MVQSAASNAAATGGGGIRLRIPGDASTVTAIIAFGTFVVLLLIAVIVLLWINRP